jgi:amidase
VALATGMAPLATGSDTGGSLRNPAAFCGIVGFRPTPGVVPNERRAVGLSPLGVLGPMGRTVADAALLLDAMRGDDKRDMWNRNILLKGEVCDLSTLRVAVTEDFGFAPTAKAIRATLREKIALFGHLFGRCETATPDCSGTDEAFAVLRAVGVLGDHAANVRSNPELCGPNLHANVAEGLNYSALDVAQAMTAQTAIYRRWQSFFEEYDVILSPAITISPRPWTELYPAEIDGAPTKSYFHWLALAYAATIVGHPALSLPVGLDQAGMPFGLQIVGPREGDGNVLAVAAALERELAGDPRTARPRPDIAALRRAPPIAELGR